VAKGCEGKVSYKGECICSVSSINASLKEIGTTSRKGGRVLGEGGKSREETGLRQSVGGKGHHLVDVSWREV